MSDLEQVIEDTIQDSLEPAQESTDVEVTDEVTTEEVSAEEPVSDVVDEGSTDDSTQVASPADPAADQQDDFAKRFGLQAQSITGRENRIPYSRVKKIIEKNERDTVARVTKEIESKFKPQLEQVTQYETKFREYEDRLGRVAQFENILENDPRTFLQMLSQVPAYKEFFDFVSQAAQGQQPQQPEQPYLDVSTMPQPDQTLSDGSKVYSLEGLAKRDEWLARQIEAKALKQAEDRLSARYAPIEQEWRNREQLAQITPVVERQIAEARTWPNFTELEPEVIKLLKTDTKISLEGAYRQAYHQHIVPKLVADKNRIRTEVLAEIRKKPVATAAPVSGVKTDRNEGNPRSIEDIIRESVASSGLQ